MLYLIDKIDANLLETVVFKYLKSSDIENSAKVYFLHLGINEGFIALLDEPLEEPVVDGPGYAASCICCLQLTFLTTSLGTTQTKLQTGGLNLQISLPVQHFDLLSPTQFPL